MAPEKTFLDRLSGWFRELTSASAPQQTDEQVEVDKEGFFFHVACDKCNDHIRLRVTRSYDLERQEGGGFLWRKTIMDGRCFRKMEAKVLFDNAYRVVDKEIEGGRFVTRDAWELTR